MLQFSLKEITECCTEFQVKIPVIFCFYREIIQFEKPFANDFDKALLDLMMKYKSPDAALDFIAERHATPREIFDPIKMTAKDYVQEMHRFLYREEKTRSERLSG